MLYDADSCLGLTNEGQLTNGPQIDLDRGSFMTVESRLWSRLIDKENGFWTNIIGRYAELRQTWFTLDKLLEYHNDNFIDQIGQRFYNQDARLKYTAEKHQSYLYLVNGTRREYTKRWLRERLIYLDSVFEYSTSFAKKGTIRTNVNDYLTLKIKMKSPRYIKVKWTDSLPYNKYYVGSDKLYEFRSPVPITNTGNNLDMLGVDGIVEIESFTHLKPSYIQLDGMVNITKCIAQNSSLLTEVSIGQNKMLQYIDFKGCENLGKNELGESTGNLNVIHCANLKYLDISNTSFASVAVVDINANTPDPSMAKGSGSIEYFNASNTDITDITIWNQTYLTEIQMSGCEDLATINVGNCERLHTMNLPNTRIATFTIVDCPSLTYIDISNTAKLHSLRLDGCPNLKTLLMQRINSKNITELDLTTCPKLKKLDISTSGFIEYITFAPGFNTLDTLLVGNTPLKSIRYGKADHFPNAINLQPLNLSSINFSNCPNIKSITNINYEGPGYQLFYNCTSLVSISGRVKAWGDSYCIFGYCSSLTTLPTLDFSELQGGSDGCIQCTSLTWDAVRQILNACGPSFTGGWRFFSGCTGISGPIPAELFVNTPNVSNLHEFFAGCSGITGSIPADLFKPLGTALTSVEEVFINCINLTGSIPATLFSSNPNIVNAHGAFRNCVNLSGPIPETLIHQLNQLTMVERMFAGCRNIGGAIPARFFAKSPALTSAYEIFVGTGITGSIPANLFVKEDGTKHTLTSIGSMFESCKNIYGEIPSTLFDNVPNVVNVDYFFKNCSGVTGRIPAKLFANNPNLIRVGGFFEGTNVSGEIPETLIQNKKKLTYASYLFKNCQQLNGAIPKNLFKGCSLLDEVRELFWGCNGLSGSIPNGLFSDCGAIREIRGAFAYCARLTGSIPEDLFARCTKVQYFDQVFMGSWRLSGRIPGNLMKTCVEAISIADMFANAKGLGDPNIHDGNPYFIDEDFLINCSKLENINNLFNHWGEPTSVGSSLQGAIPPYLFAGCSKLREAVGVFAGSAIGGGKQIPATLFSNSPNLYTIHSLFGGCGNVSSIGENIFINNKNLTDVHWTFYYCGGLRGNSYPFWEKGHGKIRDSSQCYAGASNLSDYASIPASYK